MPSQTRASLLMGLGSGVLYGAIVVLDCLELNSTLEVTIKAATTQFVASFAKTTVSYYFIVSGQQRAHSFLKKVIATYWQIPLTILIYSAFHVAAGTPDLLPKLVKITVVMCIYYTALLAHHMYKERKRHSEPSNIS